MIIDSIDGTSVITQEESSVSRLLSEIRAHYTKLTNDHLIVCVSSLQKIEAKDMIELLPLSNDHRALKKSFVIVADMDYESIPEELVVVPTIQEAYDIIEMESIERDLGL
jgi:hypothetical protein